MAARVLVTPNGFLNESGALSITCGLAAVVNGVLSTGPGFPVPILITDSHSEIIKKIEDRILSDDFGYGTVGIERRDIVIV